MRLMSKRQLTFVISMLLIPKAILVLHNINRFLSGKQCRLIANRLRLLTTKTGNPIPLISSFVSATFFELSDHGYVFNASGQQFFAANPRGLENYLHCFGVVAVVNRQSYEDLICCAVSKKRKVPTNFLRAQKTRREKIQLFRKTRRAVTVKHPGFGSQSRAESCPRDCGTICSLQQKYSSRSLSR